MAGTRPNDTIAMLRARILRMERESGASLHETGRLSCGCPEIDIHLSGGLEQGTTHEILGRGVDTALGCYATRWIAFILSHTTGTVAWVHTALLDLHAAGLAQAGLQPDRLICLHTTPGNVLGLTEDLLRETGLVAVVTDFDRPMTLTASRRLRLAAEGTGQTAFLLRRAARSNDPALLQPSACTTRWRIGPMPWPDGQDCLAFHPGRPRMRVELLRHRGGRAGEWIVETEHAPHHLSVVSPLADRPVASTWFPRSSSIPPAGHAQP